MDRICRRAGHTFIHSRTVTVRRCVYCGTHRFPGSSQDPAQLARQELQAEGELLAAMPRETSTREFPFNAPPVIEEPPGAEATGEDAMGEDAIDAWLRFRPSVASSD